MNTGTTNRNISMHVDNQAVIKTLGKYRIKENLAAETKRMVNKLAATNRITIKWVPGHQGHLGNEIADRKARQGADMKVQGPWTHIPMAESNIKAEIKKWGTDKWQKYWEKLTNCRQSKQMMPKVTNKIWRQVVNQPKRNINMISQIYTGHTTLNKHLKNMKLAEERTCEQCCEEDEIESMEHYLCQCPAFARSRRSTLGSFFLKVEELNKIDIRCIIKFVKQTQRFEYFE